MDNWKKSNNNKQEWKWIVFSGLSLATFVILFKKFDMVNYLSLSFLIAPLVFFSIDEYREVIKKRHLK